jgi:hypothetical protein
MDTGECKWVRDGWIQKQLGQDIQESTPRRPVSTYTIMQKENGEGQVQTYPSRAVWGQYLSSGDHRVCYEMRFVGLVSFL